MFELTRRNILTNQFYAALKLFSAPKRGGGGRGTAPQIFAWGGLQPPCSATYGCQQGIQVGKIPTAPNKLLEVFS